ncbi:MAG: hypothetical protein GX559_03930 [Candidatus Pacebacteria bacterium]|nr:hypothetical protein [Candidatus Paceibacterota bacterium]
MVLSDNSDKTIHMLPEHTQPNHDTYETGEKLSPKKPVVIIIEDSSHYRQIHQRHLAQLNVETIVFANAVNFNKQIAEIMENNNVLSVITDGLHGGWIDIYYSAKEHKINKIWLVSDDKHMLDNSRNYPHMRAVGKEELRQNPDIYRTFANKK